MSQSDRLLDKVRRAKPGKNHSIQTTTSVPCFEFWLLLHFTYTTKQYDDATGSICAKVITDLKSHLPDYEKGNTNVYQGIKDRLDDAINRSKKVELHCKSAGTDMPSTNVHELVEYLRKLKS